MPRLGTKHALTAFVIALLSSSCAPALPAPDSQRERRDPPASLEVHPQALSPSAPLVNPLRGLYRWNDQEVAPQIAPAQDSYERYTWAELEPAPGIYNFEPIEEDLRAAEATGRKHAFRVRAVVNRRGVAIPGSLAAQMERGWWGDADGDGEPDTFIPDWNDPEFLAGMGRLIAALGQHFGNDPRLAWVDIGFYGSWGEWHTWPFTEQYPTAEGADVMRPEHRRQIVDWMLEAFPNVPLIMGSEDDDTLLYALRADPRVGWRRDSLGSPVFTETKAMQRLRSDPEAWALLSERWRSAPVIAEFINPNDHIDPDTYRLALQQVRDFHISLVGNGNSLSWDELSAEARAAFMEAGQAAGYRFALRALRMPGRLYPGQPFVVQTRWANHGNAPAYEPWEIVYQLRDAQGQSAWEGRSGLDLRTLLPSSPDSPEQQIKDLQRLPADIPAGSYSLVLLIRDPFEYRRPLSLAIQGQAEDGAYLLGTVRIGG